MWLYKSTRVLMAKLTQIKFQKAQTACGIDCEIDCLTSGWLTIAHGPQCWYVGVRQLEKGGPCSNTSPQCKLYLVFDKSLKEAIYTLIIIPIVHKHILLVLTDITVRSACNILLKRNYIYPYNCRGNEDICKQLYRGTCWAAGG